MQPLVLSVAKEAICPIEDLVLTFVIFVLVSDCAIDLCQLKRSLTFCRNIIADNVICYNITQSNGCSSIPSSSILTTTTVESCCTNQIGGLSFWSSDQGCRNCKLNINASCMLICSLLIYLVCSFKQKKEFSNRCQNYVFTVSIHYGHTFHVQSNRP